jgi:histone H3/H4
MSVEVVRTAIMEVVRMAIMEVVRTAIVEVVRTAITKKEYNMAEIEKNLTVKKSDINMFEDIRMMNGDIVKFVVMVKEVFYNKFDGIHMRKVVIFKFEEVVSTIIDKMEYNTMEMQEELVIEENINMLEDTNMRDRVIFKFVTTVIKMVYRTAEMKKRITVKEKKSTKKREDFGSFRDIETRHCLVLEGEGVS